MAVLHENICCVYSFFLCVLSECPKISNSLFYPFFCLLIAFALLGEWQNLIAYQTAPSDLGMPNLHMPLCGKKICTKV